MTETTIALAFRKYVTDGVPSSGAHKPVKEDIIDTLQGRIGYAVGGREVIKTGDYTILYSDAGYTMVANKATAITFALDAVATIAAAIEANTQFQCRVFNIGAGVLTIDPDGAETINGAASLTLAQYAAATIWTDGTDWRADVGLHVGAGGYTWDGTVTSRVGFFVDDDPDTVIHRFRDRVLIGDAVDYTGNRLGANGYGGDWLTERGASYFIKNSQFSVLSSETGGRIGVLGASHTAVGDSSQVNIGIAAVTVNEGESSTGRALYAEAFHAGNASGTSAIEVQCGNYTSTDTVPNAYTVSGLRALYIGAEGGTGYTVGDSDTAVSAPTYAVGAAIDISGGSLSAAYQRFHAGIIFRDGSLYRASGGTSGAAKAISLAQQHAIQWEASSTIKGAVIRSDVTAVSGQDVGLIFSNTTAKITGTLERSIAVFQDDTAGSGAVNYWNIKNSRTGVALTMFADGTDTNIPIALRTKGTGVTQFLSHAGSGENLRITPPASAPTDYMTITGSAGGGNVIIGAAGASTNIDIVISPKGSGYARFGTHSGLAAETLSGYISIRDSGGTVRKVAVVS